MVLHRENTKKYTKVTRKKLKRKVLFKIIEYDTFHTLKFVLY